ncbi:hypothetical protein [Microvirga antarctica]|uniref:hypothetical protein n=1 Tax=Microvirga antarctica TaxID=2819233 RepID=UPI001B313633|nr:hypothetical protein [Microvirga antarctica]
MVFSTCEGWDWSYDVCEHADGYLVQMRDLISGDVDEDFSTIFRTLPVAFAYAEMSAAYERFTAAGSDFADNAETGREVALAEQHFVDISDRLRDTGTQGPISLTWDHPVTVAAPHLLH